MLIFEFILLSGTLLTVGIALRRLSSADAEAAALHVRIRELMDQQTGSEELAAMGVLNSELCQMIISPLTVILGQCELARRQAEPDRRLQSIEKQARRIASVVERHRGICPSANAEVSEVDPRECARSAIEAIVGLASEREVRIHEMLDDDMPRIKANSFLLVRALRHLLRAGVEAAPKGMGDVTLAIGELPVTGESTHIAFAVADDGPGIDPVQLPHVFHPFPDEGGSWRSAGSSYAIAYAIARAMGANLVIDTAPGAGTRATLKVPLRKRVETQAGVEVLQQATAD